MTTFIIMSVLALISVFILKSYSVFFIALMFAAYIVYMVSKTHFIVNTHKCFVTFKGMSPFDTKQVNEAIENTAKAIEDGDDVMSEAYARLAYSLLTTPENKEKYQKFLSTLHSMCDKGEM